MLSSISGHHAAGHWTIGKIPVPKPAKSTNTIINYDFNYGSYPTGTGTTITDVSGNGYNATLYDQNFVYSQGAPNSMQFSSTELLTSATVPTGICNPSNTGGPLQMNIWIKPQTLSNYSQIFQYLSPASAGFTQGVDIAIISDKRIYVTYFYASGLYNTGATSSMINVGVWNMVSVQLGATTITISLNGVQALSSGYAGTFSPSAMVLSGEFGRAWNTQWNAFELYNHAELNFLNKFNAEKAYYGL